MKDLLIKLLVYGLSGLGILLIYVKYIESKSLFFPDKDIEATPDKINLSFEDVYFSTSDKLRINAWFLTHPQAAKTLLFFHGNAGNISHRLDKISLLRNLRLNILIIDYRGYGASSGKPKEKGLYLDALAAYDYLIKRAIRPQDIIVYGESLGAAVAIDLAAKREVAAIILEGGFSSARDIGHAFYPYLPKLILPDIFNSLAKIKKAQVPKLFLHSQEDEVVPFRFAKKLYDSARPPKKLISLKGSHNGLFIDSQAEYLEVINEFIRGLKNNG